MLNGGGTAGGAVAADAGSVERIADIFALGAGVALDRCCNLGVATGARSSGCCDCC